MFPLTMELRNYLINIAAGILTGFALSLTFWWGYGVFVPSGFIIWSIVTGVIGGYIGTVVTRHILGAVIFTAVIRTIVFVVLSGRFF